MAITSKKKGLGARIKSSLIPVGVGAGLAVVDDMAGVKNSDAVGMAALGGGIILPAFFGGMDELGNSLATGGAFMLAKNYGVASKLGLLETATTTGLGDRSALGNTSRMFVDKKAAEKRNPGNGSGTKAPNPMG